MIDSTGVRAHYYAGGIKKVTGNRGFWAIVRELEEKSPTPELMLQTKSMAQESIRLKSAGFLTDMRTLTIFTFFWHDYGTQRVA